MPFTPFDTKDNEIVKYIAEKGGSVPRREVVEYFATKWGVTRQAVYKRIKKLFDRKILAIKYVYRNVALIQFSNEFLFWIEEICILLHKSSTPFYDRYRKFKERRKPL